MDEPPFALVCGWRYPLLIIAKGGSFSTVSTLRLYSPPLDGVTPYRLEMQAKAEIEETTNLYDYWGDRLYHSVIDDSRTIINLASKEYSKCIERYLSDKDNYITITFCELSGDKLVTKGTYAKMARGEMVRFMAENNIENPVDIQKFDRLGYTFRGNLSSETEYVFERKIIK